MKTPAALSILLLTVGACAQLPASGPSAIEIVSDQRSVEQSFPYIVVEVDAGTLAVLSGRKDPTFAGSFGDRGGGGTDTIGVGDRISIAIWEAGAGGLFSSPATQLGTGSNSTLIPEQPVSPQGTISVPYAGSIRAAGRSPDQVKAAIEAALSGKAIEPQVLVQVSRNLSNTVTVISEGATGGRVPLSTRGDRLLDVIATGGGLGGATHEYFVQLARGGRVVRVPLQRVVSDPSENIYLAANDVVTLVREPQTFTAFGATGGNSQISFNASSLALSEALAMAGGLQDHRADPAGVFVFREETPEIARRLSPDVDMPITASGKVPVVYRINLREASGLFIARDFRIYNKDLLYVTNAPFNELQKFLLLVGAVMQPVQTGAYLSSLSND